MKTLFSIVALAMSVAAGQAAKIDKANISNDAKFVVHLDLDAFRASKIGTAILEKIRGDEGEKLDALVEIMGFDPLSAIHGATMFGNGEEDNGILVLKHKADITKLLAFMKLDEYYRKTEHGKHEIHGAGDRGDGKRGYVSFVNATTAVLAASRELAAEGIDLVNGKGAAVKQIPTSFLSAGKKAKYAFLVAYANVEDLKEHIDNESVNQMAKQVAFVMGESDEKFILSISVDALDTDAAENMESMINGLIGFARLNQDENPEVKDILKGLKATRNEENVSVHFSIGVDKLFELIDPALKEIDIDLPKP